MRLPLSALTALLLTGAAAGPVLGPRYAADGALRRPDGVDRWVAVGTSLGLGYSDRTSGGVQMFHRVYLEPSAYDAVRRTGRFPSGTMLALSLAPAAARVPPARDGVFADRVFTQFYPLLRDRDGGALPTSPSNGMLSAPD
jgi:hypothetical protein